MSGIYKHEEIEPKWQAKWDADGLYEVNIDKTKQKYCPSCGVEL